MRFTPLRALVPFVFSVAGVVALGPEAGAQCNPVILSLSKSVVQPNETITLTVTGVPGTPFGVLIDTDAGPTFIPGIGMIDIGFSPDVTDIRAIIPPSGSLDFSGSFPCGDPKIGEFFHLQAISWGPSTGDPSMLSFCLSNPVSFLLVDTMGVCAPCVAPSSISANFNGTAIPAESCIWFNAVVKVTGTHGANATVSFKGQKIEFIANGVPHTVSLPDSVLTFSTSAAAASVTFDAVKNEWHVTVPASYSGNVFLGGGLVDAGSGLPGGIKPVTWSGQFSSDVTGLSFQWKWASAVYSDCPSDPNDVGVKPIDGSTQNPYPNSDHAGAPEAIKSSVIGGAMGGGGSNVTGSYSGTRTAGCQ